MDDGSNILRLRNTTGETIHQIAFDKYGNVMTETDYLSGEGLNIQNGTLDNYMVTWPGGGTGPGYEKMLLAKEKAENLTEGLTFENGQWSPE